MTQSGSVAASARAFAVALSLLAGTSLLGLLAAFGIPLRRPSAESR